MNDNDDAGGVSFPPEADGGFDTVKKADIAKLRDEMEAKFGIGQSRLTVIDDPKISSECPAHVNITALPAH